MNWDLHGQNWVRILGCKLCALKSNIDLRNSTLRCVEALRHETKVLSWLIETLYLVIVIRYWTDTPKLNVENHSTKINACNTVSLLDFHKHEHTIHDNLHICPAFFISKVSTFLLKINPIITGIMIYTEIDNKTISKYL